MLELEEALERILCAVPPPHIERVALAEAYGRIVADGIPSPIDLPLFDNSAMDGYAVRATDTANATRDHPVRLRLAGKVAAGSSFAGQVAPGTCVRLFTGSSLPAGADAVLMQEDTRVESDSTGEVLVLEAVKPWKNVRLRGEDVRQGTTLIESGARITTGRLNLLAAVGTSEITVGRQPVVGILATGSELREAGEPLSAGQIYESNRLGLAQMIRNAGGIPRCFPLAPDTLSATRDALRRAVNECDLVVTTGGVSVGELDFVKAAVEELAGSIQFWRVAIKPGKPFAFGKLQGKLLFGLPGNPVSAAVTFLLLVRPALLRCQGARELEPLSAAGFLMEPLRNPGDRRHFVRVTTDTQGSVRLAGIQASHMLSSLAAANGLVEVPAGTNLPAGARVKVICLN